MKNLGYIIKRLGSMNYKRMWEKIGEVHRKTGRSRLAIFKDMQHCAAEYGAGYMDYDLFEFYAMTEEQRNTFLTRGRNNALVRKYNNPEYTHFFNNKDEFNRVFAEFVKRDWVLVTDDNREEVLSFLSTYNDFVLKPLDGKGGKGIEKLSVSELGGVDAAFEHVANAGKVLLEELIIQHPAVAAIYPDSVNTVRIVTIRKEGETHIVAACFRIGNGKHVDNFSSGGMVALVDEVTGVVKTAATDRPKNVYTHHPITGAPILGFAFPDWEGVIATVKSAAEKVPEIAYTGWDVAFTADKGPCLIEGNSFPGHDLFQLPQHHPDRIGMYPKYDV